MNFLAIIVIFIAVVLLLIVVSRAMQPPHDPAALYEKLDAACVNDIHVAVNKGIIPISVQQAIGKPLDAAWNQYFVDNACLMLASPIAMRMIEELPPDRRRGLAEAGELMARARADEAGRRGIDLSNANIHAADIAAKIRAAG